MNRSWYTVLATLSLSMASTAAILAAVGGLLGQTLAASASLLCAGVFGVPGIYFLGHVRRLAARDVALAHAGRFAQSHRVLDTADLASELHVSREDAERILRTAIREGYASGTFDDRGQFVAAESHATKEDG